MKSHARRAGLLALGFAALLGALWYSIRHNPQWQDFDPNLFLESFRQVNAGWLALAVGLIYGSYGVRAVRWRIFLEPLKPQVRLGNLLAATIAGFGAISLLGRPGEFVRPYLIAKKEDVPISSQLAAWFLERSFDCLIVLALVAFAVAELGPRPGESSPAWWNSMAQMVGVGALGTLALVTLLRHYYDRIAGGVMSRLRRLLPDQGASRLDRLETSLQVFGSGLGSLWDWNAVLRLLIWSGLLWMLIIGGYMAGLRACAPGFSFTLTEALVFTGVSLGGSLFQIPGVGGGIQIAAVLVLTELFRFPVELASSTAIIIWFLTFVAVLPAALIVLVREGINWAKLREIEHEI
jgi:uncharacterized membrane protein YbhN (UPF0104 family)